MPYLKKEDVSAANRRCYEKTKTLRPEVILWRGAKARAKAKGLEFSITPDDIKIPKTCPVLGIELFRGTRKSRYNYPSVDRKDNDLGYVKGNIAVISMKANLHKSDLCKADIKGLYEYVFGLGD